MNESDRIAEIESYYFGKIKEFGPTAQGVDWKDEKGQQIRFNMLLEEFNFEPMDEIFDYGCGYGAFYEFLKSKLDVQNYFGCDIVQPMVNAAISRNPELINNLKVTDKIDRTYDYVFASGVFNVKNSATPEEWSIYVKKTVNHIAEHARKGFAINFLTNLSEQSRRAAKLYYPAPVEIFNFLNLNRKYKATINHSYDLWEFTIIIQK